MKDYLFTKGTPEGKPIFYRLRFAGMFSGIIANIQREADRSRIVTLEMHRRTRDEDQRRKLNENLERFNGEFGTGLLRRMLDALSSGRFESSLSSLRTAIRIAGGDERKADVFAQLLAANHNLTSDKKITDTDAATLAGLIIEVDEGEPSNEEVCLSHLLGHEVSAEIGDTRTIGEWLLHIHDGRRTGPTAETVKTELERHGVKVDGSNILVANSTPGIKAVYERSRWASGSHSRILRRLPDAQTGSKAWFAGVQSRCIMIPLKAFSLDKEA